MNFSHEQIEVIECPDRNLTVNAFTGAGKTSTLVGYAEARPEDNMLYIAFNSSVAAEARLRFPRNVECRTSHSVAYAAFGASYRHKLGTPRARDALDYLMTVMAPSDMGLDRYFFAQHALRRVNTFFASGTLIDEIEAEEDGSLMNPSGELLNARKVAEAAQRLWEAMKDVDNLAVQLPHDGYLKLFQLSEPNLNRYDRILLDEAQDTNPCLLNIIQAQNCGKVLVGDRHQNIYGFRQSVNAMAMVKGSRLDLTQSFRFGERIARVSNAILGTFCGEEKRVKGMSRDNSPIKDTCYLHRTNAGLFGRAAELVGLNKRPHFVGGVKKYAFENIVDTWKIQAGLRSEVRDPFLRRFQTFADLESYAESVDDREIKSRMKIVSIFGQRIPSLVEQITRDDTSAEKADATLTTAHQAKGLEWDHVILGDDFPDMMVGGLPATPANARSAKEKALPLEEANLAYVAGSRARKHLTESPSMADFLRYAGVNRGIA